MRACDRKEHGAKRARQFEGEARVVVAVDHADVLHPDDALDVKGDESVEVSLVASGWPREELRDVEGDIWGGFVVPVRLRKADGVGGRSGLQG